MSEIHIKLAGDHAVIKSPPLVGALAVDIFKILKRGDHVGLPVFRFAHRFAERAHELDRGLLFEQALAVGRVGAERAVLRFAGEISCVGHGEVNVLFHPGAAGVLACESDGARVNVGGEDVIVAGIFAAAGKIPLRLPYAARQAAPRFGGKLAVQPRRAVERRERGFNGDRAAAAEGSQKSPRPR